MGKIIVENSSDLTDARALEAVALVMAAGRISNGQYCYHTTFTVGALHVGVSTFQNKKSDRFVVINDRN